LFRQQGCALLREVGAEVGGAIWTAFFVSFVLAFFTPSRTPSGALGAVLWLVNRLVKGPHEEVEPRSPRLIP
jgi:hypothetical protein